jgi:6,7-dimethyl-8-ribityllumazine synthase
MLDIPLDANGRGLRIAVVVAAFNAEITDGLLAGALKQLAADGVADDDITVARVPGALELPVVAERLARVSSWHAVVTLGCVIRGETDHYDFVCSQATRGCGDVALEHGLPVMFGVLTCDTQAQARARSGDDAHNKGAETARAAVQTANMLRELEVAGAANVRIPRAAIPRDQKHKS